jgi:hypothetical protein
MPCELYSLNVGMTGTLVLLLKDVLSLLALAETANFPLSDLMTLPQEQDDKEEGEDLEEGHQAISPVESHVRNPRLDVESHRESKAEAECVQDDGRLRGTVREDLAGVAVGKMLAAAASHTLA